MDRGYHIHSAICSSQVIQFTQSNNDKQDQHSVTQLVDNWVS